MTKILTILISTIGLFVSAKADTIDYWHIYYNKIKIKECNQYTNGEIVLKSKDIKRTDSLTVFYFRDTHCSECTTQLLIRNDRFFTITESSGTGTSTPITVSVFDLLIYYYKHHEKTYYLHYYEGDSIKGNRQSVVLLKILIE